MNTKFFTIDWLELKSALASGVLMALTIVILEVIKEGNIYVLDWKTLLNTAIIAFLTSFVSFLKSLLTTSKGTLAGIKIK